MRKYVGADELEWGQMVKKADFSLALRKEQKSTRTFFEFSIEHFYICFNSKAYSNKRRSPRGISNSEFNHQDKELFLLMTHAKNVMTLFYSHVNTYILNIIKCHLSLMTLQFGP